MIDFESATKGLTDKEIADFVNKMTPKFFGVRKQEENDDNKRAEPKRNTGRI